MRNDSDQNTPDISDVVHTSGYAREQNPGIGAMSPETFLQRLATNRSREIVPQYKGTAGASHRPRQPRFTRRTDTEQHGNDQPTQPRTTPSDKSGHEGFKEPPSRGYNPYA